MTTVRSVMLGGLAAMSIGMGVASAQTLTPTYSLGSDRVAGTQELQK